MSASASRPAAEAGAGHTHIAHVAVVALHTLCCGLPIALSLLGLAASAAWSGWVLSAHAVLHDREGLVLAVSVFLVLAGALAEWRSGRRRPSRLFVASLACCLFNAVLIGVHHLPGQHAGGCIVDAQGKVAQQHGCIPRVRG